MPSSFQHTPTLTVAASNTTAGAAVKWVASQNLGESLIILDSGGNGRIGLAGDLDLITLTSGTVTVAGTVSATLVGGAAVKDEDNMASDSATHLASQQSIKAYVDANGGPSQANQAAVEARTNEDTYVPPDLLQHHKGVAKAWCMVSAAGSLNTPSYNIDSIHDTGTGNRLVTFVTHFSNSQFNIHGLSDQIGTMIYAERTSASTCRFYTQTNATTPVNNDRYAGLGFYGDQ